MNTNKAHTVEALSIAISKYNLLDLVDIALLATHLYNEGFRKVPEGKWERYGYKWKCSVCGSKVNLDGTPLDNNLYYCSNCGAKMTQEN